MDYENNYNDTENVGITEKSTEVDAFSEADQTTSGTDTSDEQVVYFDPEISYSASSTYNFEVDNAKAAKAYERITQRLLFGESSQNIKKSGMATFFAQILSGKKNS